MGYRHRNTRHHAPAYSLPDEQEYTRTMASYLILAAVAALAYYIISTAIAWHRLRHFPGPALASVSSLWMAKTAYSGKVYKIFMEIADKYGGSLIRIGPDHLVTHDVAIIRRINAARSPYRRDSWYTAFGMDAEDPNMFSTIDDTYHNDLKSKTAAGYSGKDVPSLEADIDDQLVAFKNLIRRKYISTAGSTKAMDMAMGILFYTSDTISKLAFGEDWGQVAADADVRGVHEVVRNLGRSLVLIADTAPLRHIVMSKPMLRLMGPKDTDKQGFGWIMG